MIVKDLISLTSGRAIAFDAMDGKQLFDTKTNKKEFIKKYEMGRISSLWASAKMNTSDIIQAVIMMYIVHDSWNK